jgi:hypothetical protein
MNHTPVEGFSKLSKQDKINWLLEEYLENNLDYKKVLEQYIIMMRIFKNYTANSQSIFSKF